jgi:hypothetical protein
LKLHINLSSTKSGPGTSASQLTPGPTDVTPLVPTKHSYGGNASWKRTCRSSRPRPGASAQVDVQLQILLGRISAHFLQPFKAIRAPSAHKLRRKVHRTGFRAFFATFQAIRAPATWGAAAPHNPAIVGVQGRQPPKLRAKTPGEQILCSPNA